MDAGQHDISGWQLVVTSATPTLLVCLLGAVGALLAHKGILNAQGCQVVARLCFYVYTPALTFAKLVQAVSISSIAHLWPLLLNMTVSIVVGLGLGWVVARLLRTPPEFRVHALVAIAFGNVGNLPLVFVSTLCHDKQAMFYRSLRDNCEHLGIAYVAFDIAAATLWQFTLAINLIRRAAAASAAAAAELEGLAAADGDGSGGRAGADGGGGASGLLPLANGTTEDEIDSRAGGGLLPKRPTVSDLLKGRRQGGSSSSRGGSADSSPRLLAAAAPPRQQQQQQLAGDAPVAPSPFGVAAYGSSRQQQHVLEMQQVAAPPAATALGQPRWQQQQSWKQQQQHIQGQQEQHSRGGSESDEDMASLLPQHTASRKGTGGGAAGQPGGNNAVSGRSGGSGNSSSSSSRGVWGWRTVWRYLQAVDWGAAFPLPSQAAILGIAVGCIPPLKGLLYAPHPPLRVLSEGLDTLGSGLIPTTIPLLGAVLYRGPGASRLPRRVTVGVLLTRLIIQPALLTALVVAALSAGLFTAPDPMFLLTLLLSNATPTAINMQTLTVLYKFGEAEMSSILFWQYLASVATLPAAMWVFLRIIHVWVPPV